MNSLERPSIAFGCDFTVGYCDQTEDDVLLAGGSFNGAVDAVSCGVRASVIGPVGRDAYGTLFIDEASRLSVDTHLLRRMTGTTSQIVTYLTENGEVQNTTWDPGVTRSYHIKKKELDWIHKQDAFVYTGYAQSIHILDEIAHDFGKNSAGHETVYVGAFEDLSGFEKRLAIVEKYMRMFSIFHFELDEKEDEELIKDIILLSERTNKTCVIALEQSGAIVVRGDESYRQYWPYVPYRSAYGAADAHLAAFLTTYLKTNGDLFRSLEVGAIFASKVAERLNG